MSASFTSAGGSGFLRRAGTTIENEPIVKSDGSGEMMQWQPSDGGADGVFIVQNASDGAANLGVGITPTFGNIQADDASGAILGLTRTAGSNNDDLGIIRFGNTNVDANLVQIIASQDGSTDSGRITFETQATGAATSARMAINSTGTMSLTANDPQLILSDSAGTNKTDNIERMVNLLQVSSPFGRTMETINRKEMVKKLYPQLSKIIKHR